jgi:phosphoglycerate dehydrogenase-like enzyme
MGMLVIAKNYREVARAQDRHEWLSDAPGKLELHGSKALIVGAGAIGKRIAAMLAPFHVAITEVRRRAQDGALGPDQWRARLGEFDWVIVAVPATADTNAMFGAAEFAAMKRSAAILNFARGTVIDQTALIEAVEGGQLGGAFLDVTDPEPLPAEHPLWSCENIHISQHLSGRSQTALFARASERFLENLARWEKNEPLLGTVDLYLGY